MTDSFREGLLYILNILLGNYRGSIYNEDIHFNETNVAYQRKWYVMPRSMSFLFIEE